MEHPWLNSEKAKKKSSSDVNLNNLRNFVDASKFQKAVLTCMASQLSEHEILDLRKIFLQLDKNGDGTLTLDELTEGIYFKVNLIVGLSKIPDFNIKEIQAIMHNIDTDKSGRIDYTGKVSQTKGENFRVFSCYNGEELVFKRRKTLHGI